MFQDLLTLGVSLLISVIHKLMDPLLIGPFFTLVNRPSPQILMGYLIVIYPKGERKHLQNLEFYPVQYNNDT